MIQLIVCDDTDCEYCKTLLLGVLAEAEEVYVCDCASHECQTTPLGCEA